MIDFVVVLAVFVVLSAVIWIRDTEMWHRRVCSLCRGKYEREKKLRERITRGVR